MNSFVLYSTIFGSIILPILLILWIAFNRGDNKLYRLSIATIIVLFITSLPRIGVAWFWLGDWWAYLYIILLIPSLYFFFKKIKGLPWLPAKKLRSRIVTVVMVIFAISTTVSTLEIPFYRDYENGISLDFPLKNGTYIVIHGGSSDMINHHFEAGAQRYALDISKLNESGRRASGLLPKDLSKYEIMGEPLYSPCEGEVLKVENSLKDQIPVESDQEHIIGNHVFIYCQESTIVLAHMKEASVKVKAGDKVEKGTLVGAVGNSGNTTEPHLHIHATKGRVFDEKVIGHSGDPVPMVFEDTNEKFLIRNDKVLK